MEENTELIRGKRLILFDLYGTIVLPFERIVEGWSEIIHAFGLKIDYRLVFLNSGKSFPQTIIPLLAEQGGWKEEQVEAIIAEGRRRFIGDHRIFAAELPSLLQSVRQTYDLGVVTNHAYSNLVDALDDVGLNIDDLAFVHTADNGIKKPNPEVFTPALKKFPKEEILFIGTSPLTDVPAAYGSGLDIAVISSYRWPQGMFEMLGVPQEMMFPNIESVLSRLA